MTSRCCLLSYRSRPSQPPAISRTRIDVWRSEVVALLEVLLCSDSPDAARDRRHAGAPRLSGRTSPSGQLSVGYVVALSLVDAVLLDRPDRLLLYAHGERPRDVLFGRRPIVGEGAARPAR